MRGYRGRESASSTMRTAARDPISREFYEAAAVVKKICRPGVGAAFAMSALDYHRPRAHRDDSARRLSDRGVGIDPNRGDRFGLRNIRRDDASKRNQQIADGAFAGGL